MSALEGVRFHCANTPHNKNRLLIADILALEGLEVSD